MIYENYDAAKTLVEDIEKLMSLLKDLERSDVVVILAKNRVSYDQFQAIGTWVNCEHPLRKHAEIFRQGLIEDTSFRIRQLKRELEKL